MTGLDRRARLSYLCTSEGGLSLYFSQRAGESGLTTELSCIIRVAHSQSQARPGEQGTTVVRGTLERVGAPEALLTSRYGKLGRRSRVSCRQYVE